MSRIEQRGVEPLLRILKPAKADRVGAGISGQVKSTSTGSSRLQKKISSIIDKLGITSQTDISTYSAQIIAEILKEELPDLFEASSSFELIVSKANDAILANEHTKNALEAFLKPFLAAK